MIAYGLSMAALVAIAVFFAVLSIISLARMFLAEATAGMLPSLLPRYVIAAGEAALAAFAFVLATHLHP